MNTLTDLPQICIGELGKTAGMFLAWFESLKLKRLTLVEKKLFLQTLSARLHSL